MIAGNKGADTIREGIAASTDSSVGGGSGHAIAIGTAQLAGIWVNGGAGNDSIRVDNASAISSLSGGGLADTISFGGAFAGGIIYGDAAGVEATGSELVAQLMVLISSVPAELMCLSLPPLVQVVTPSNSIQLSLLSISTAATVQI